MRNPRILIIDDEVVIRQLLQRTLSNHGYDVEVAEDGKRALEKIKGSLFNLLITDLKMPKISGMEVLEEIKKTNPFVEVIIITGYPTIEAAVAAIKVGAYDFICKPFDLVEVREKVKTCLLRQQANLNRIEVSELNALFDLSKASLCVNKGESHWERILTTAIEIVGAKQGGVFLFDRTHMHLVKHIEKVVNDGNNPQLADFNIEVLKRLAEKGSPVLIANAKNDSQVKELIISEYCPGSLIVIPLVSNPLRLEESILGVVVLSDKQSADNFSERDEIVASILAGQAATMIKNVELYQELEQKVDALKLSIQELHETQNQLIQTEKLSSVGQLAFGIAHEIRNPLGIVLGGVENLATMAESNADNQEIIDKIKLAVSRANSIIVDLLKFSRASKLNLQPVNICKLLDEAISLVENKAYLANVKIKKQYEKSDYYLQADTSMLRQALFNLCNNAIDAMPKGGKLMLNIFARRDKKTNESCIVIEIKDTGEGIAAEILSQIFVPFFTTKEPGKGTGLGLSIVHMIVERHNAIIKAESTVGKGTVFTIEMLVAYPSEAMLEKERANG